MAETLPGEVKKVDVTFSTPHLFHPYLLKADGRVQREGQVIHVLTHRLEDLSDLLANQEFHSRDFQ
jgi:hypothetical protein